MGAVDFGKGIAIIAIVILHALYCQPSFTSFSVSSNPLVDFLYAALLLFFIISGYFYKPERSTKENITKRLIQLTLFSTALLLIFPAILTIYYVILGVPVSVNDYIDTLWLLVGGNNVFQSTATRISVGFICGTFPGYYYVQMMIVSCIIFYPTVKYVIKSWVTTLVTIFLMLSLTALLVGVIDIKLPFFAHLSPLGAAFMYVGAFIKKYDLFDYLSTHHKEKKYWLILIAVAIITVALLVIIPPGHAFDSCYFGEYGALSIYPFFVTVSLCCYVLMVLFSLAVKIPVLSTIVCCEGRHTLVLLLCHAFIIKLLTVPFFGVSSNSWFPKMPVVSSVTAGLLALILPLVVLAAWRYIRSKSSSNNVASSE